MGEMVIAAYRPKPGRAAELEELVRAHVPFLRGLGLATERPAIAMRARDGTILEVFEWRDGGTEAAHSHPEVRKLWEQFGAVCDYPTLAEVPEAQQMFAGYTPLD